MAVIPLVLHETVADNRQEFDANKGLSGQVVLIQDIEAEQLDDDKEANATYDLRIGPEYRYLHQLSKHELPLDNKDVKITLKRGESVLILTEEHIYLPKSIFGVVVTKVGLVQQGTSNPPSKVDPGYDGPLIVTVTNHGKVPVDLRRGQRFCSIFFLRMEDEAKPYSKSAKRIIAAPETKHSSLGAFVEEHTIELLWLNLVLTIVLMIAVGILFWKLLP